MAKSKGRVRAKRTQTTKLRQTYKRMLRENPGLVETMRKLRISQELYEKTMIAMYHAETLPQSTNVTATSEIRDVQLRSAH
jgi:hypothetical protein